MKRVLAALVFAVWSMTGLAWAAESSTLKDFFARTPARAQAFKDHLDDGAQLQAFFSLMINDSDSAVQQTLEQNGVQLEPDEREQTIIEAKEMARGQMKASAGRPIAASASKAAQDLAAFSENAVTGAFFDRSPSAAQSAPVAAQSPNKLPRPSGYFMTGIGKAGGEVVHPYGAGVRIPAIPLGSRGANIGFDFGPNFTRVDNPALKLKEVSSNFHDRTEEFLYTIPEGVYGPRDPVTGDYPIKILAHKVMRVTTTRGTSTDYAANIQDGLKYREWGSVHVVSPRLGKVRGEAGVGVAWFSNDQRYEIERRVKTDTWVRRLIYKQNPDGSYRYDGQGVPAWQDPDYKNTSDDTVHTIVSLQDTGTAKNGPGLLPYVALNVHLARHLGARVRAGKTMAPGNSMKGYNIQVGLSVGGQ